MRRRDRGLIGMNGRRTGDGVEERKATEGGGVRNSSDKDEGNKEDIKNANKNLTSMSSCIQPVNRPDS